MTQLKVLIVDDEQMMRNGLRNLIAWQEEGFTVVGDAVNGRDALEKIQLTSPDIVITDIIMPEMDGIDLAKIIQQRYPAIRLLILSSYDDFDFVSNSFKHGAVDYLLKPRLNPKNLLVTLKSISTYLTTKQPRIDPQKKFEEELSRLFSGYQDNLDLQPINDFLTFNQFAVLFTKTTYVANHHLLQQLLETKDLFNSNKTRALSFSTSQNEICWLIAHAALSQNDLLTICLEKLAHFCNDAPHGFFILSNSVNALIDQQEVLRNLRLIEKNQAFFFKQQLIVHENELFNLDTEYTFDTNHFLFTLMQQDYAQGLIQIEDYFDELILKSVSPNLLKQQASSIFYTFFSRLEENPKIKKQLGSWKTSLLNQLNSANYLEDFSLSIVEAFALIKETLDKQLKNDEHHFMKELIGYIQGHYQENLTLSTLAEQFHFSYNYLSTYFTANYHMNFSDYLNSLRIKQAKILLVETSDPLSEISAAVGYSDLSYFSKVFKKESGMPPSKYRRGQQG